MNHRARPSQLEERPGASDYKDALAESEHRYRQLVDSLPQLVWTCDAEGRCDYINQRWAEYTGVPAAEQMGRGVGEHFHPEDRGPLVEAWKAAVATGTEFHHRIRIRRHDGAYRYFEIRGTPLRDTQGRITKWFGSNIDVHDAHVQQERLNKIAAVSVGVIHSFRQHLDGSTSFPYVSPGIVSLYGIPPEVLMRDASLVFARIHPEDNLRLAKSIAESAQALAPFRGEWRIQHPEKGQIWIEGHSTPVREPDGSTTWHGILIDITERKRVEEELRTSRGQLLAALQAGDMGTWSLDLRTRAVWLDDNALKVWGLTREQLAHGGLGMLLSTFHPDDRQLIQGALTGPGGEQDTGPGRELRILQPDGSVRWLLVKGHLERDTEGQPLRWTGVLLDVTARKREDEHRLRSQKLEALGTLAGGISHDFNNILLAITGHATLATADLPPDHPVQESLAEISKAGARAISLVRQILTFSRPQELEYKVLSLQPVVEEALKLVRATVPAMVEIRCAFAPDAPQIAADSTQIHQILVNLATNAAHAIGSRSGLIEVNVEDFLVDSEEASSYLGLSRGRYARLSLSDNGCGMDPATLARIFDPFFTTKAPGRGTGLGLSVVHGIVKSHKGAITVHSQPGKGSLFHLYFPEAEGAAAPLSAASVVLPRANGERVLYVDDEGPLVLLVRRTLERLGYQVTGCTSPKQGLDFFRARPDGFDVVITDFSMPSMSGLDFVAALREVRPDVPVVLTSGYLQPEDQEAVLRAGIRDILFKPLTLDQLGDVLHRLFAGSAKARAA